MRDATISLVRKQIHLVDSVCSGIIDYAVGQGTKQFDYRGFWATNPGSDGVMFLDGEQPLVRKEVIDACLTRFAKASARIVAPSFDGKARNPMLFHRELYPELLRLTGDDRHAAIAVRKAPQKTALVECGRNLIFGFERPLDFDRIKELA